MATKDLTGKTYLVTGANTGIGRVTAETLAARGGKVLLACRSEEKTRPVIEGIKAAGGEADFVALDLADLTSVRKAADSVLAKDIPLHGLLNNAGLAGHFFLTTLLLPLVQKVSGRIVNVASKAHYDAKPIDWSLVRGRTRTVTGLPEYAVSKLSNVLFTKELAGGKAGSGVHSYALHPGVVASDAWRQIPQPFRWLMKLGMISLEEGARTTLFCATSPEVANDDGLYYDSCKPKRPSALALDGGLAKELWSRSEEWIKGF
jgi:NAD(P)-dependent dehydrogenase (short-subunit alcohol dehydrogenase family)